MPPVSTVRTFIEALRTGRTNITRALDQLLANPGSLQDDPDYPGVQQQGALNGMPEWLRARLTQPPVAPPLRPQEIDHIERWPNGQKEIVRAEIVTSIQQNRRTTFAWEHYRGSAPVNEVRPGPGGGIEIVFRSPGANITLTAAGEIDVAT